MAFNEIFIRNPPFHSLGYVLAVANLQDKHDRSAPSDYHWKILKCRMIIFSNSSILACPDEKEVKQIHIIFNIKGDDYDKLISLFMKFSLLQKGEIGAVTNILYKKCFQYTMLARIAPAWNSLGSNYLINNRDFLTTKGPQDGLQYNLSANDDKICLQVTAIKMTLIRSNNEMSPGEVVRVLPSLNKAIVEDRCDELPQSTRFKTYKDLKRHWKNIHGYRLPNEEGNYYLVRFWRGEPLTYPQLCVMEQMPVIVPRSKQDTNIILTRFVNLLKSRMEFILREPIELWQTSFDCAPTSSRSLGAKEILMDTQAVSLCTPTQCTKK